MLRKPNILDAPEDGWLSGWPCRRCRDIGPFFWKIPQYLGSRWHNWSPNVATVTGWMKCLTEEVPVLRDTLYKQSSLDQEQCWFTWNCLATALGSLLIFPIDMYLTCVTVSVFYFAISLESFLSLTWSQSESNPTSELTCLRATKCIPLYKEFTRWPWIRN